MEEYCEREIHVINIQVGCILRLNRLKNGLSQHDLALLLGTNPTMIGRVERSESISGWDKIYMISRQLNVDFCSLFILKSRQDLLSIVEDSLQYEVKLSQEKKDFYSILKETINKEYDLLES